MAKKPETKTGPSPQMLALFKKAPDAGALKKLTRRNMPQLIKPDDVPVGQCVEGDIKDVVPSPGKDIKGFCLWLTLDDGNDYLFPATGTIQNALAPGLQIEKDKPAVLKALKDCVGLRIYATRGPDGKSKNYGGNRMFMFDVFTGPAKKKAD